MRKKHKRREVHGLTGTYWCRLWHNIRDRCHNPLNAKFEYYGGRGISVKPEWRMSCSVFAREVEAEVGARPSPTHSIDRVDNEKGYVPGNLRWATKSEQQRNKQCSDISGRRFGKLVALRMMPERTWDNKAVWLCQCDCGGTHMVRRRGLLQGNTKSCGCLRYNSRTKSNSGETGIDPALFLEAAE